MPRSKPPRKKKRAATPVRRKPGAQPAPDPIPDRRAMERFLGGLAGSRGEAALRAAQEFMYDAWEAPRKRQRLALARKALKRSPLCADAYVLLAEETAGSVAEAIELYRRGVEAGELAVGAEAFEQDVGHFWGLLQTRPYMRARSGLAQALWLSGEREDAIAHYRDMLRLNPNDNQGIRYLLAAGWQEMERYDELDALLEDYAGDGTAAWTYTQALAAFRDSGDSARSRRVLAMAMKSNRHVPALLLRRTKLPRPSDDYVTWGGKDEAIEYVREFGAAWERTPGAVAWLRDTPAGPPEPAGVEDVR